MRFDAHEMKRMADQTAELQRMAPMCAVCQQRVMYFGYWRHTGELRLTFYAECHGDREETVLSEQQFYSMGGMEGLVGGMAFAPKQIERPVPQIGDSR